MDAGGAAIREAGRGLAVGVGVPDVVSTPRVGDILRFELERVRGIEVLLGRLPKLGVAWGRPE